MKAYALRHMPSKEADPRSVPIVRPFRLALLGLAGASIEWYDFFIYATAAALVFPTVFFPPQLPPLVALIASYSTFAVGFVARPLGALLFGYVGDRIGRKGALAGALVLMGTATTLIGILPSYGSAGALAPLALVILRLLQGLAIGGQWGGSILLATESAPPSRRGLYGSITQAGVPVGVVLANLAFFAANAATSPAAFIAYGWRLPFLLSILLVGFGIFIHYRVREPGAFRPPQPGTRHSPLLEALRRHPRAILLAAGAYLSTILNFYILITYVVSYGTSVQGLRLPRSTLLAAVLIANVAMIPITFLAGDLSDRFGRRRLLMIGVALAGVWAFALFPLLDSRAFPLITVAILVGGCLGTLTSGPVAALFAELFSAQVRCSAVSLAYQTGAIAGGGFAPIIATALFARYHSNLPVSLYVAGACAVSLVCAHHLGGVHSPNLESAPVPSVDAALSS